MPKSKRVKFQQPIDTSHVNSPLQFQVKKDVEDSKKIKEKDVFVGVSKVNNKRSKTSKK